MTTIEYNNETVNVPDSWDDLRLEHYESFCFDEPETAAGKVELLAKICKVDVRVLLEWPAEIFNLITEKTRFVFGNNTEKPCPAVEIDGVRYVVPIEEHLALGAWVDVESVQKSRENVLSGILAIVCRPAGERYDSDKNEVRQAMFATLPVARVLPVIAFFLSYKTALDKHTNKLLNFSESVALLQVNIKNLLRHGDGIKLFRIWRAIRLRALMLLLNYRLLKYLRSCNIDGTKIMQRRSKKS
jgi:hypothetical protein